MKSMFDLFYNERIPEKGERRKEKERIESPIEKAGSGLYIDLETKLKLSFQSTSFI